MFLPVYVCHSCHAHAQVYLVVGGITCSGDPKKCDQTFTTTVSTELLVDGDSSWSEAGPLPRALYDLQTVSIDNHVISTGGNMKGKGGGGNISRLNLVNFFSSKICF